MKSLAIIPARGGSKRIPRKNIKDFLGKPIIAYSIEAALKSDCFDEVMVSTDDAEIAEIAKEYGAKVPFMRSAKTADDFATTVDVLLEVLEAYAKQGQHFDYLCCIYPCAPLIQTKDLKKSFTHLFEKEKDSVIPIVPFSFPIQRAFKTDNQELHYIYPEHEKARSQDLEPAYHDAGQFYWIKTKALQAYKSLVLKQSTYIKLEPEYVQDIDHMSDWRLAEMKYTLLKQADEA